MTIADTAAKKERVHRAHMKEMAEKRKEGDASWLLWRNAKDLDIRTKKKAAPPPPLTPKSRRKSMNFEIDETMKVCALVTCILH